MESGGSRGMRSSEMWIRKEVFKTEERRKKKQETSPWLLQR
jgi:hypothetical protein